MSFLFYSITATQEKVLKIFKNGQIHKNWINSVKNDY